MLTPAPSVEPASGDCASGAGSRPSPAFAERHGLLLVAVSPIVANLIGSMFNILYNALQIQPLLTAAQNARFQQCCQIFNAIVYPVAVLCWVVPLWRLRKTHRVLLAGGEVPRAALQQAQRWVVNLPWRIMAVAAAAWLICVPVFPAVLGWGDEPLNSAVAWHLMTSFWTAGLIAITHSFFAVELVSQRALFPVYFPEGNPSEVPGAVPLSITGRGVLWTLSAVISPVVSLVLLLIVPQAQRSIWWFGVGVGGVAILYSMTTAWMMSRLVARPVRALREASTRVAHGDLNVCVDLLRADDFGRLIASFNQMVAGLRERERLQQTFGRHVGREAAGQILAQGDGLVGSELEVTVMFVDVRNFTAHSSNHSPAEVVSALNIFFREAVDTIERQGGMVNKFLGDGLMALFGIGSEREGHAERAVAAAQAMLCCLEEARVELQLAGWPGLAIGIGINTGKAIVGSIGSPQRQEYTAIGDTVNVASRVEALTKQVGRGLLITEATRSQLTRPYELEQLPLQQVKGKGESLQVWAVTCRPETPPDA